MNLQDMSIQEISELEKQIEKAKEEKFLETKGDVIFGFKITRSIINDKKKDKVYPRKVWQAYKYVNGKNHVVYIGKDPTKAKEKIQAYLKKNNLEKI